jgi:ABC-2 type transport system permease protein
MMSVAEAAWVIARRDFIAQVYSRSFILFLLAPLLIIVFALFVGTMADDAERIANQPVVAMVTDTETGQALERARSRLVAGTSDQSFPILRPVAPAEDVRVQARALLADEAGGYSAVLSGTLEQPMLTGPQRIDEYTGRRIQLIIDEARQTAALDVARATAGGAALTRDVTEQAAGNLQMTRRTIARGGQGMIFTVTLMIATLLLSTLVEEKSNKVIEVLAASVPLDAVFLGKLLAMLGISMVGLGLWCAMLGLGYTFVQILQDWVTVPDIGPAVGWPVWIVLLLIYYVANFMLLGALFLGIGGQASNIREIQTISMPVTLLQLMVILLAMRTIGGNMDAIAWVAYILPFSSPMSMVALAAESATLWPHLLAILWQAFWVVIIIRISARMFRRTVLKSSPGGSLLDLGSWTGRRAP